MRFAGSEIRLGRGPPRSSLDQAREGSLIFGDAREIPGDEDGNHGLLRFPPSSAIFPCVGAVTLLDLLLRVPAGGVCGYQRVLSQLKQMVGHLLIGQPRPNVPSLEPVGRDRLMSQLVEQMVPPGVLERTSPKPIQGFLQRLAQQVGHCFAACRGPLGSQLTAVPAYGGNDRLQSLERRGNSGIRHRTAALRPSWTRVQSGAARRQRRESWAA